MSRAGGGVLREASASKNYQAKAVGSAVCLARGRDAQQKPRRKRRCVGAGVLTEPASSDVDGVAAAATERSRACTYPCTAVVRPALRRSLRRFCVCDGGGCRATFDTCLNFLVCTGGCSPLHAARLSCVAAGADVLMMPAVADGRATSSEPRAPAHGAAVPDTSAAVAAAAAAAVTSTATVFVSVTDASAAGDSVAYAAHEHRAGVFAAACGGAAAVEGAAATSAAVPAHPPARCSTLLLSPPRRACMPGSEHSARVAVTPQAPAALATVPASPDTTMRLASVLLQLSDMASACGSAAAAPGHTTTALSLSSVLRDGPSASVLSSAVLPSPALGAPTVSSAAVAQPQPQHHHDHDHHLHHHHEQQQRPQQQPSMATSPMQRLRHLLRPAAVMPALTAPATVVTTVAPQQPAQGNAAVTTVAMPPLVPSPVPATAVAAVPAHVPAHVAVRVKRGGDAEVPWRRASILTAAGRKCLIRQRRSVFNSPAAAMLARGPSAQPPQPFQFPLQLPRTHEVVDGRAQSQRLAAGAVTTVTGLMAAAHVSVNQREAPLSTVGAGDRGALPLASPARVVRVSAAMSFDGYCVKRLREAALETRAEAAARGVCCLVLSCAVLCCLVLSCVMLSCAVLCPVMRCCAVRCCVVFIGLAVHSAVLTHLPLPLPLLVCVSLSLCYCSCSVTGLLHGSASG